MSSIVDKSVLSVSGANLRPDFVLSFSAAQTRKEKSKGLTDISTGCELVKTILGTAVMYTNVNSFFSLDLPELISVSHLPKAQAYISHFALSHSEDKTVS